MALNEQQGGLVLTEFGEVEGAPNYKVLVCEQDSNFENGLDITEEKTKCGTAVALEDPTWSASGTAVLNSKPDASEVSYRQMLYWMNNKIRRRIRIQSAADPELALAAGEAFYQEGVGYVTSMSNNYGNGAVVKFDWTFSGQGNLITSNVAVLTQPVDDTAATGAASSFTVVASGGIAPLTYQWQKAATEDGVYADIPGATAATYNDANSQPADEGFYRAVITDAEGNTATSDPAELTVT